MAPVLLETFYPGGIFCVFRRLSCELLFRMPVDPLIPGEVMLLVDERCCSMIMTFWSLIYGETGESGSSSLSVKDLRSSETPALCSLSMLARFT